MIRSPLPTWQWKYIPETGHLSLQLTPDETFVTAFQARQLADKQGICEAFSVEQTESYYQFAEQISSMLPSLPEAVLFHIAVHAVAASHYHKSIGNKSWLFKAPMDSLPLTPLVLIETSMDKSLALILDSAQGFATIMLLSEQLQVPENKPYKRYNLIKCNSNLLSPVVGDDAMQLL